jgi:hypothetical protein
MSLYNAESISFLVELAYSDLKRLAILLVCSVAFGGKLLEINASTWPSGIGSGRPRLASSIMWLIITDSIFFPSVSCGYG